MTARQTLLFDDARYKAFIFYSHRDDGWAALRDSGWARPVQVDTALRRVVTLYESWGRPEEAQRFAEFLASD